MKIATRSLVPCLSILLFAGSLGAATPLVLTRTEAKGGDAALKRLLTVDPTVPGCRDDSATLELAVDGTIDGAPAASFHAQVKMALGPTVLAGTKRTNIIQNFSGRFATGDGERELTWDMYSHNGGTFFAKSVSDGERVVFLLPARFDRGRTAIRPILGILSMSCSVAGGSLQCANAHFVFEKAFPAVFGGSQPTEQLFHRVLRPSIQKAVAAFEIAQRAKRPAKVRADGSPFLDCCYGGFYCGCTYCDGEWPCPIICENCIEDSCFDCDYGWCDPC